MPAIFSRQIDSQVRQAVVGLVTAIGLFIVGWYYYALPSYTRVGYQPDQPVPFSHELHAGHLALDCTYCHTQVFDSTVAGVPMSQTCMNYHNPAVRTDQLKDAGTPARLEPPPGCSSMRETSL